MSDKEQEMPQEMPHLTEDERARRAMTSAELTDLGDRLRAELKGEGIDPARSDDARAWVLKDVDRILRQRANARWASAIAASPEWPTEWKKYVHRIASDMVAAHAGHVGKARGDLQMLLRGDPASDGETIAESYSNWRDRYEVLEHLCAALPGGEGDPVVIAFRRVLEDRREPLYSYTCRAPVHCGPSCTEDDPVERARHDERLSRYLQVWRDLEAAVRQVEGESS